MTVEGKKVLKEGYGTRVARTQPLPERTRKELQATLDVRIGGLIRARIPKKDRFSRRRTPVPTSISNGRIHFRYSTL
jgi:hypothetical protein